MTKATDLIALAGQCSALAASLLSGPFAATEYVQYVAQGLLKMAQELVECSFKPDPYLWHVQSTCWDGVHYWYKWLTTADLTAEQDTAFQAIAQTWVALVDASEVTR